MLKAPRTKLIDNNKEKTVNAMMRLFLISSVFLALAACGGPSTPSTVEASKRTIDSGEIVGSQTSYDTYQWLGIPYAEAPVEALRWQPPQDKKPMPSPLKALRHGPACSQSSGGTGSTVESDNGIGGSEDCLYLNVYGPKQAATAAAKKPVMVWVHGGSNTHGSANIYNGSRLVADNDVVVVTINYRLGAFGWFDHPALKQDGDTLANSGNFGTLDIIKSLEWVQNNIAVFGGDPSNVTLFGESAGAFDTLSLMQSPLAKGLFHRAISESGGLWYTPKSEARNYQDAKKPGSKYSSVEIELILRQQDGSATSREEAKAQVAALSAPARADYLRNKSQASFMAAYGFYGEQRPDIPLVFQDGAVISRGDPIARFTKPNKYNAVPLIIGSNRDEIKLYYYDNPKYVNKRFGLFPVVKNKDYYDARAEAHSKRWKYTGVDQIAEAIALGNQAAKKPASVWAYRFDWDEQAQPMWVDLPKLLGASHGMEIPFVFGFTDTSGLFDPAYSNRNEPGREALSKTIRGFWSHFARQGKPEATPQYWPAWQASAGNKKAAAVDKYLVLDTEQGGGLTTSNELVSPAALITAIAQDARLPSLIEKCEVYASLVNKNPELWSAKTYHRGKPLDCRAFPLPQ